MQTKIQVSDFNLDNTLFSGQFFYIQSEPDGWHRLITDTESIRVKQEGNTIEIDGNPELAKELLNISQDFAPIKAHLEKDSLTSEAHKKYPGIRIMKQSPWQCLIGFVCSSASNIPKIKKNILLLSKNFGQQNGDHFLFPKVGKINNLATIESCATGFRSNYIYQINSIITESWLNSLYNLDYEEAKKELMILPGVGEKIADCVLLFAYGKQEAFPVDIWIKRVIEEQYLKSAANNKKIKEFGQTKFAPYAGYSQQYLYQWRRLQK